MIINGKYYYIPQNYKSQATSPKALLDIFGWDTTKFHESNAVKVHDFIYEKLTTEVTRKQADKLFKKMLIEQGESLINSELAYRWVRAFGWLYWYNIIK